MADSLHVVHPGVLTTVQDGGRRGWESLGISQGGVLDFYAYTWANRLAGNAWGAAVLEIMQGGLSVLVPDRCWVATTGTVSVSVDGDDYPSWSAFWVESGSIVAIRAATAACAYLAVHGGIEVPEILGSRATNLESGFGGFEGRPLKSGDWLPIGIAEPVARGWRESLRHPSPPSITYPLRIHVVRGPGATDFPENAFGVLYEEEWVVDAHSSRMGIRLQGGKIQSLSHGFRISEPMPPGGVQVTPAGDLIVLLNARGTIGGYPLIATATSVSLWKLGQARFGDTIRFVPVSVAVAQALTRETWMELESIRPTSRPMP